MQSVQWKPFSSSSSSCAPLLPPFNPLAIICLLFAGRGGRGKLLSPSSEMISPTKDCRENGTIRPIIGVIKVKGYTP